MSVDVERQRRAKAGRSGKISHVTRIINQLNDLVENEGSCRLVTKLVDSLNEALKGAYRYNDEYIETLDSTEDEEEINQSATKIMELERKCFESTSNAEQYLAVKAAEDPSETSSSSSQVTTKSATYDLNQDKMKRTRTKSVISQKDVKTSLEGYSKQASNLNTSVGSNVAVGAANNGPFVLPPMIAGLGNNNFVPLPVFNGNKANWRRFIQTFEAVVHNQAYDDVVKLAILESHLSGPAVDCIKGFPFEAKSYPLIVKALEVRFGSDEDLEELHLDAIESLDKVSNNKDIKALRKFYDELQAHVSIIEAMGPDEAKHLDDPKRLKTVLGKLPRDIVFGWTKYRVENGISTDLTYFCHWLCKRVTIAEKAEIKTDFRDIGLKKFSGMVVEGEEAEKDSSHYSAKRSTKEKQNKFCWVC